MNDADRQAVLALFPNASADFIQRNIEGFVRSRSPLASKVCDPKPKHDARPKPLDPHKDEKGSQNRSQARVKVTITRHGSKLLDIDNGAGGCKALIDALRYEKCIVNDDPGTIDFIFRQVKTTKDKRGTEILIEPA
jgi:hypothetical protein